MDKIECIRNRYSYREVNGDREEAVIYSGQYSVECYLKKGDNCFKVEGDRKTRISPDVYKVMTRYCQKVR